MKKTCLFVLVFTFLIFSFSNLSYGWQGRMGGMGDPYGLVQDESDFLIHPAKIANGKGINFYGGYRFNYTDVTDWKYNLDRFNPAGTLIDFYNNNTSGDEYRHNALLGAAFPLGPGRMGLFFEYAGKRGDYDGHEDRLGAINYANYDLTSDLDNFALRLLYGLPIGGFKLGGEFQIGYRQEEHETWMRDMLGLTIMNYPWGGQSYQWNLFPFMFPYDSKYWEALFKGSLEGKVGPLDLEFTLRGGFLFGGSNKYKYDWQMSTGVDMDGDVHGWRIGGDLWARYPLTKNLSLPFLVRVDYQAKTRDGDGLGFGGLGGFSYKYKNQERNLQIEVGGGVDKEFDKGTRIAAGVYYNYLQSRDALQIDGIERVPFTYDYSDYPTHTEHRVLVRFVGEHKFSPAVALQMGLGFFYGWAKEGFKFTRSSPAGGNYTDDVPLNGNRWGIGASIGGTVKFQRLTLEPFINAGYQKLDLKGDGERTEASGAISNLWEMDKLRKEWSIGGGFSIKF